MKWGDKADELIAALRADPDAALIAIRESKILGAWEATRTTPQRRRGSPPPVDPGENTWRRLDHRGTPWATIWRTEDGEVLWYVSSGRAYEPIEPIAAPTVEDAQRLADERSRSFGWILASATPGAL